MNRNCCKRKYRGAWFYWQKEYADYNWFQSDNGDRITVDEYGEMQ